MEPAVLRFGRGQLSVAAPDGKCLAAVTPDGSLRLQDCGGGKLVRSPLRAAFRVVEPEHGLQRRGELTQTYPVQALAFGRQLVILGLGGTTGLERFRAPGFIVIPFANDAAPPPGGARLDAAVRDLLRRVGR
jgi:hypothetical protein